MYQNKKTILIIDDAKDLADAISIALQHEDFYVLTENSGVSGLEVALRERPDLILLDIEMPDITGLEVLTALRKDEWGKDVVVIVMTVVDDFQKMAEVIENKVDSYILKSDLDLFKLIDLVKEKLV